MSLRVASGRTEARHARMLSRTSVQTPSPSQDKIANNDGAFRPLVPAAWRPELRVTKISNFLLAYSQRHTGPKALLRAGTPIQSESEGNYFLFGHGARPATRRRSHPRLFDNRISRQKHNATTGPRSVAERAFQERTDSGPSALSLFGFWLQFQ